MSRREEYNSVSEDPTWFDFIWYMVLGGFLSAVLYFVVTPNCPPGRELARRAMCADALKHIGEGMVMYAEANNDRLPEKPSQVITEGHVEIETFICPSVWELGLGRIHNEDAGQYSEEDWNRLVDTESDYVFIFRCIPLAALSKERIEAYELLANHYHMGLNMMNLSGEVKFYFLDKGQWRPRIQESHDVLNQLRKEKK